MTSAPKITVELYTDYLISNFGQATGTGLSDMLDGQVSHDQVTRFLSKKYYDSRDLWLLVKSAVRQIEEDDAVLAIDNTIQEKSFTDESDIMCWHYDHSKGRHVRGLNILNVLYHSKNTSIPVAFEVVTKDVLYCDVQTHKIKRMSLITQNELMRRMVSICINNQLKFKYIVMDSWFGSVENFKFIRGHKKHFIVALKENRLVALSKEDKKKGRFIRIDQLQLSDKQAVRGWLKDYDEEVILIRQVFKNKDGSTGLLNLVCSDLTCDGESGTTLYKKRWKVEEFHKSLKSNAGLAKSPTHTIKTQKNHVFMSMYAVFKLECLRLKHKTNHFALRTKLFIKATKHAFLELQSLQAT